VQDLALELQRPGLRVVDALEHRAADLYLVAGPHLGEPGGEREHLADHGLDPGISGVPGVAGAQVGDSGPGEAHEVLVGPADVGRWPAERPADHVPVLGPGRLPLGGTSDEMDGELVPGQDVVGGVDHVCGSVRHAVKQVPDTGRDLAAGPDQLRRGLAGRPEQVVALVAVEHQRPGKGGKHLP
jgi:hypothetical protein